MNFGDLREFLWAEQNILQYETKMAGVVKENTVLFCFDGVTICVCISPVTHKSPEELTCQGAKKRWTNTGIVE